MENQNKTMSPEELYELQRKEMGKFYFDPDRSYMAKLYADHLTSACFVIKEKELDVIPERWRDETRSEVWKRERCAQKPTLEEQIKHIRGAIIELAAMMAGGMNNG